jgi:hypothetical protein
MASGARPVAFISFIMIVAAIGTLTNSVSADETVDNYPEGDAWLRIDLISWEGNQSDVWDSDGSPPDPRFRVCVDADGDSIDCFNSPTWENNWTLGANWSLTLDIPDDSFIINLTIECKDNDALNDDECDMNPVAGEWKLYFEFNWTTTTQANFSGDGRLDNDTAWREAASNWSVTIFDNGDVDEDGDGIPDFLDDCPDGLTDWTSDLANDHDSDGCRDGSEDNDDDNDGIPDLTDDCPDGATGWTADISTDHDSDGCKDSVEDDDDDADGYDDQDDSCPLGDVGVTGAGQDVDEDGCNDLTEDDDVDNDGVLNGADNCAGTPIGADVDTNGCAASQRDGDNDGVYDDADQCPSTPALTAVDVLGCARTDGDDGSQTSGGSDEGSTTTGQQSGSSSEGGTIVGGFLCMALIVGLLFVLIKRGISSESSTVVQNRPSQRFQYAQPTPQPQMVTTQNSPPIPPGMNMQSVVNVLEQKQKEAAIEAEKMRQQLASKSASEKQMEKMQSELARLQESMADAENTKIQMQQEMEELRKSGGDSGLQMQDSVIGGDSMVGSTKIESQIINDPEAIARAAIEAYRMAKNEEND